MDIEWLRKAILKEEEILKAARSNSDPPELPSSDPAIATASILMIFNRNTLPKPNGKRPATQQGCVYCKEKHNSFECTVVRQAMLSFKKLVTASIVLAAIEYMTAS